ncbi:polysaccharide biosynthesis protein [Stenotrophomonas sp. ATCM1_4]|uniref:rhamnan synthesis F family protein n=1 Tax=Stenotrophomonas sp. ATCM1_4 TaxID=2259330 RepID=UPI00104AC201|nr:rhamnan synthesis F family protein [Stenotrophomonas sp. ATCM1_4]TDB29227.1 polysaccharide biosynthesis protein [Stenotrophomonas sp. ATCM1_4]
MNRYLQAAQRSIQQHGGGIGGLLSVVRRAMKITAAMGIRGVLDRLRSASASRTVVVDMLEEAPLPAPVPQAALDLRVGVMAHVFYPDLIDEFVQSLRCIPVPFTLLVSVSDAAAVEQVQARMKQLPNAQRLSVKVVENRGRDIAPLLVNFHDEILALDVISHIHTKKSLYTGGEQNRWRRYLLNSLFGSSERVAWILGTFQASPELGLVYPESYEGVPLWGHTVLSNGATCDRLAARLGIALEHGRYLDYPAGSMFWARVNSIRPLFDLHLRTHDFPPEQGQVDGTLQHAMERMFGQVVRHRGYRLGILPTDGGLALASEGLRNIEDMLSLDIGQRLRLAALQASTVSVDVFDTLVVRPFLSPDASRAHLAQRMQREHGITEFMRLRGDAETSQRIALQRDPTLAEIYRQLARQLGKPAAEAERLMATELEHERQQLRPRVGVVNALMQVNPTRRFALSDMYLDSAHLKQVLPDSVAAALPVLRVSCETGLRKDRLDSWQELAHREDIDVARWLHVGDNEHADVQLPQLAKLLTPVHILRPSALLDVIPALRPLRHHSGVQAPWPEQFWRGLLVNRFAFLLDSQPQRLLGRLQLDAEDLGYAVLGPLLLDFLLTMLQTAIRQGVDNVLFLSREGHLLHQAFERLQPFHPSARQLRAHYFLASRRATALPAMHQTADVSLMLEGNFNGTLRHLLQARAGDAAVEAAGSIIPELLDRDVFLPEMATIVAGWLQPALPAVLARATQARANYMTYWSTLADTGSSMVVDIGYAGTIQRNLARLRQQPLGGYYMALRADAGQLQDCNWAQARYFDGRQEDDAAASPILSHDLLLEALLSAPSGQFNGFEAGGMMALRPLFGQIELDEQGLQALQRIHQGALTFIDDVCAMLGEDIADIELDAAGVLMPLQCVASGRWNADDTLRQLTTDDSFTGRGRIAAAGTSNT